MSMWEHVIINFARQHNDPWH